MVDNITNEIEKAQKGDKDAMAFLVEKNQGLIWSIVKRFTGRGYETEDLYQIGCIGFIKAIQRFDTSFEVRLSTYAVPYILGEIKRYIRDDGPIKVSRSIKELNIKILELDNDGWWLYQKKLFEGQYIKPKETTQITKEELYLLLNGLSVDTYRRHKDAKIKTNY